MSLPIEYTRVSLLANQSTKRQRTVKAQLIMVSSGTITVHLGRQALRLRPQQILWLPHDCLHSIAAEQDAVVDALHFSARVTAALPQVSLQCKNVPLLTALIAELASDYDPQSNSTRRLLQVCLDQVHKLTTNMPAKD